MVAQAQTNTSSIISGNDQSHVYALQYQARCLEPLVTTKESEESWFMAGTNDPGPLNELHVVRFDDSDCSIVSRAYKHPGMITSISPCPQDFRLVFTGHTSINTGVAHGATLWQISEDLTQAFASTSPAALIKVVSFPGDSKILKVLWDPTGFTQGLIQLTSRTATYWSLSTDMTNLSLSKILLDEQSSQEEIVCGIWHASSRNILLGRGSDMLICDVRSPSVSVIDSSHVGGILSVDGNPHLPYRFVSGGCDGMVKFWDHRQPKGPLQQMSHHTHWVWDVAFNPQYDQLLVTAGSDCLVNLESVGSLSSLSELGADSSRNDKLIGSFSHEESVYNVAWSPSNPWLFSSISFDGQLMFHSVPDNEKYDILL